MYLIDNLATGKYIKEFFNSIEASFDNQTEIQISNIGSYKVPTEYSLLSVGLILKYLAATTPNLTELQQAVLEDIKTLSNSNDSASQKLYNDIGCYFVDLIQSKLGLNSVYYRKLTGELKNFLYIKYNKTTTRQKSLYNTLTSIKNNLKSYTSNVIVLAPDYFDADTDTIEDLVAIILKCAEVFSQFNIKFLKSDLVTDLKSRIFSQNLLKTRSLILDDGSGSSLSYFAKSSEPRIKDKIKTLLAAKPLYFTKTYTDSQMRISGKEFNYDELYALAYLTINYGVKPLFEDVIVEKAFEGCVNNLFTHNYDTLPNKLRFISSLENKQIVLTRGYRHGDIFGIAKVGNISNYISNFQRKALKLSEIINAVDTELKLLYLNAKDISFDLENIIDMENYLESLDEELVKKLGGYAQLLVTFQRLAVFLLGGNLVSIKDLVIVYIDNEYYLTYLNSRNIRIPVEFKDNSLLYKDDEIKIAQKTSIRIVSLSCIMPIQAYNLTKDLQDVEYDIPETVNIKPEILDLISKSDSEKKNRFARFLNEKRFYEALVSITFAFSSSAAQECFKAILEYESNLAKLIKFDTNGEISFIDTVSLR